MTNLLYLSPRLFTPPSVFTTLHMIWGSMMVRRKILPVLSKAENASKASPFFNTVEASEFLRVKKRTLENMRWQGNGPVFRKHGGTVVYHRDDLMTWSKDKCRNSTSY